MKTPIRVIAVLILVAVVVGQQREPTHAKLTGRWHVTFSLQGDPKKNLIFEPKDKGAGTFKLLDTGVDNKPVPDEAPAVWSELTNKRVSFSGELELQLGNCCRESGTLIFKGKFKSDNSIEGGLIFVTSVDEEESPYKYRSYVGTFTATLVQ
ncbi:MAG TPA: hypothetical protein VLA93_03550 [Pyrinomonadaceae bacterium]|nr:hypothetical protein [Pyrinomonadaceae bacterium]